MVVCDRQSCLSCDADTGVQRQHNVAVGLRELGSGYSPFIIPSDSAAVHGHISVRMACSPSGIDCYGDVDQGRGSFAFQCPGDKGSASGPHQLPGTSDRTI